MGIIIIIASVAIGLLVMLIGLPLGLDPDLCLLIGMGILFGGCFWGVCVCNGESSYTPPVATTSHTASSTTNNNFGSLNSHDFSDNEVLAFARNNYQYRKNILEGEKNKKYSQLCRVSPEVNSDKIEHALCSAHP